MARDPDPLAPLGPALTVFAGGGAALRPPAGLAPVRLPEVPGLPDLPRSLAGLLGRARALIRPGPGAGIGGVEDRGPTDAAPRDVSEADEAAAFARADLADVDAVLGGDGDAFTRIVERHQAAIARSMYRFTRDRVTYEELVQDVFVEAFRSLPTFRGTAPLRHWLRRIALRVGYRHWRDKARRREATLSDDELFARLDAAGPGTSDHEAGELVHHLLAKLRPRDRLVLTLMYLEGLSVKEIAETTGWSVAMVKVQAHRARKRMRAVSEDPR